MIVSSSLSINTPTSKEGNGYIRFNGDLVTDLPLEITAHIASFLTARELCRMACASKHWKQIFEIDVLWAVVARSLGIEIYLEGRWPFKEQVRLYHISPLYPLYTVELIEALGGLEVFCKIPILNLGDRKVEPNMILHKSEVNSSLMRGIDLYKRPFIVVRYMNQKMPKSHIEFEILYKANLAYKKQIHWLSASIRERVLYQFVNKLHGMQSLAKRLKKTRSFALARLPYSQRIDYISRLAKGEPCGLYDSDLRSELDLITNGKSTVFLI